MAIKLSPQVKVTPVSKTPLTTALPQVQSMRPQTPKSSGIQASWTTTTPDGKSSTGGLQPANSWNITTSYGNGAVVATRNITQNAVKAAHDIVSPGISRQVIDALDRHAASTAPKTSAGGRINANAFDPNAKITAVDNGFTSSGGGGSMTLPGELPGGGDGGGSSVVAYGPDDYAMTDDDYYGSTPETAIDPSLVSTSTPVKKPWWKRFLIWLGLMKDDTPAATPAVYAGDRPDDMTIAGSVVRRARAGDQNAMALIQATRANAQKGNPRSAHMLNMIQAYCRKDPTPAHMASSVLNLGKTTALALRGPRITANTLNQAMMGYDAMGREAFRQGVIAPRLNPRGLSPHHRAAFESGRRMGIAQRMQMA